MTSHLQSSFFHKSNLSVLLSIYSLTTTTQERIMLTPNSTLQHGRYRIIRPIGQGGMGAVYEGYDNNLKNRIAIKEALVNDPSLLRAFEREAQRLARLRHIALPRVIDHFTDAHSQYLVMEYIEGQDLSQMLKQRKQPFPVADVLAWADTLLDALAYLHQEGVIHRDIKPANIKLTPKGQIILLDFGLAKGGVTRQTLIRRSLYGYTPGYAPPEQMEGEGTDERSDLYALGATLYALLTAKTPDDPLTRRKYIQRGYPDPLLPLDELNPQVPAHVVEALQQATAIEPANRANSAAQMRAMLKTPHTQPVGPSLSSIPPIFDHSASRSAQSHAPTQPSVSTSNNNRVPLFLGVVMAAVLLIGVLAGTYFARNSGKDEPTIVVITQEPAPTDEAIAVQPTATEVPSTETEAPTAIPTLEPGATAMAPIDGMVLRYVPAGEFEMGATDDDADAEKDERPRHTVYLDAFWIDQTEVTNAMFANFLNQQGNQVEGDVTWLASAPLALIENLNGTFQPKNGFTNHPVVAVSWYGANAYCKWAKRRLPTEAEWEKAAGGIDGRKYPWGNDLPTCKQAQVSGCEGNTVPVGSKPAGASPYKALDMAGNVWEWVSDYYNSDYYASAIRLNPTGAANGTSRAFRGGSWVSSSPDFRVRNRDGLSMDFRSEYIGFRCAGSQREQ